MSEPGTSRSCITAAPLDVVADRNEDIFTRCANWLPADGRVARCILAWGHPGACVAKIITPLGNATGGGPTNVTAAALCNQAMPLCLRWGPGSDRCIKPEDHAGDCEDAEGNTTTSLTARYLGQKDERAEHQRVLAQALKDRIDLRDALTELCRYVEERDPHFKHWSLRDAQRVLRRTA